MAIIPWKPFGDLEDFFNEENWLLPAKIQATPKMDIYETKKDVVAEVNLPGIDPKNIDITVKDGLLKVAGVSEKEEEKEDKERGYWKKEIYKGSFERLIRLPAAVKEDKTVAVYKKGILKITIPKAKEALEKKPKKVKVEVKD